MPMPKDGEVLVKVYCAGLNPFDNTRHALVVATSVQAIFCWVCCQVSCHPWSGCCRHGHCATCVCNMCVQGLLWLWGEMWLMWLWAVVGTPALTSMHRVCVLPCVRVCTRHVCVC